MDLFLFLTKECNFRCEYCYVPFSSAKMEWATIEKAVELVGDNDKLSFFGGEPMLVADTIKRVVRRLDERGVKTWVKLFTNGSLYDEELTEVLVNTKRDVIVQVSYDGKKQREGGLSVIEENIAKYTAAFKDVCHHALHVEATIAPGHSEGLADGIEFMYSLGVRSFGIVPVVEMSWTEGDVIQYFGEMEQITKFVIETYRAGDPAFAFPITLERNNNNDQFGCGAGKETLTVGTDGSIWRCHRYYAEYEPKGDTQYRVGHINDIESIAAFEATLDIAVYIKDMPKCRECGNKQYCSKCHYANVKMNGDPTIAPTNGFCEVPNVHRMLNEVMVHTLYTESNPMFINHLGTKLSEAVGEYPRDSYTKDEVDKLAWTIVQNADNRNT